MPLRFDCPDAGRIAVYFSHLRFILGLVKGLVREEWDLLFLA